MDPSSSSLFFVIAAKIYCNIINSFSILVEENLLFSNITLYLTIDNKLTEHKHKSFYLTRSLWYDNHVENLQNAKKTYNLQ